MNHVVTCHPITYTVYFCHIPLNQGYPLTLCLELSGLEMLTLTLQVGTPFNSVALTTIVQYYKQLSRCNNNGLLIIPISSTCFGR